MQFVVRKLDDPMRQYTFLEGPTSCVQCRRPRYMRYNVNDSLKPVAVFSCSEQRSFFATGLRRIGTGRYETALRWRSCLASLDGQEATGIDIVHARDLFRPVKLVVLYDT
jgi:hypothetical protein